MRQLVLAVIVVGISSLSLGCQRDDKMEHADKSAEKAVEAIERHMTTPVERAKAVEGLVQKSAERPEQSVKAGE